MKQNKALTVYKASAGSGKTFTLAAEFIKLLILDPNRYKEILAVTFTNKATEEMKHRIVSELYGLAKRLPDSNDYMEKITSELNIGEETVSERAGLALHNLLHNYNMFRVQTIDAFFQSVLRNMAKEIGLGNNMRIALNDKQIISDAVDNLFDSLDNDKQLFAWIMDYISEVMDADKSWNIKGEVKQFGENLSKEFYKSREHMLDNIDKDENFFKRYKTILRASENKIKEGYKAIYDTFISILSANGFSPEDLKQGAKGVAGYFLKLKNGNLDDKIVNSYVRKAMDDENEWGSGKTKKDLATLASSHLMELLNNTEKKRKKDYRVINSINLTLKNINKMRLLTSIRREVEEMNNENSRFMLSNTQTLLNNIIQGGDKEAPFIFEKIGAYLKHIMIDEFQDTSIVQWKNFKVLLKECLSIADTNPKGAEKIINNLIVGDVKQSIYRFRSGDWRLLNDIDSDLGEEFLNIEPLETNWRSEHNIIEFNNRFFEIASKVEAENIMPEDETSRKKLIDDEKLGNDIVMLRANYAKALKSAYSDVRQKVSKRKMENPTGLVRIEMLPAENAGDYQEQTLKRTLEYTKSLIEQGAGLGDIAILVRGNKEATLIANYFATNAPQLKIVSEQAFALKASPLVQAIMATLKFLANKKDIESRITLLKLYNSYILGNDTADNLLLTDENSFTHIMPEEIADESKRSRLMSMSLYELVEHIYQILNLEKIEGQEPYTCAFFDGLKNFLNDNGAIIEDFIEYWNSELGDKAIAVNGLDSIVVITIHKSKGLEYKHVIMPFTNWRIGPRGTSPTTLWCEIEESPFSELPFIPVNYTGKTSLSGSIYDKYGTMEWMQDIVDNLNLLYVAFTRAERSLFIITDQNIADNSRTKLVFRVLQELCNEMEDARIEGLEELEEKKAEEAEPVIFTFGKHCFDKKGKSKDDDENKEEKDKRKNVFEMTSEGVRVKVRSFSNKSVEFRQSNKSREFANDSVEDSDRERYTTMGSIMHLLFSQIKTTADIDKVLRQFEFDGVIYDDEISPEALREKLKEKFSNPTVADWFSDKWTIFNECNIMSIKDGKIKEERPDRVITDGSKTIVIDYKFGKRNEEYRKQVLRYIELLRDMGYENITGYLWYVNEEDGVEIVHRA